MAVKGLIITIADEADHGENCLVFRFGLEAALLASHGMEGNHDILDMSSGFGAFYHDYNPEGFLLAHSTNSDFILHSQVGRKQQADSVNGLEGRRGAGVGGVGGGGVGGGVN